jgi:hypothetical protein
MGDKRSGIAGWLLGRLRREDAVVMDDGEFERLFLEPEESGPAEQGEAGFESLRRALLETGERLRALAGDIREANRKIRVLALELEQEARSYGGGEARRGAGAKEGAP